jgi:AcrR family transcriptional regulator
MLQRNKDRMSQPSVASAPLNADDWLEAAFDLMAEGGIDAVRVEPLAKRLKVSRGSFYWHFADRDSLYAAMLKRWRERASYTVHARVERSAEPAAARLARLLALPYSSPRSAKAAAIELAVRLWARRDKRAAKAVRHIDRVRLDYFEKLMEQRGLRAREARQQAFLFYAALMAEALIMVDNPDRLRDDLKAALLDGSPDG